MQSPGLLRPLRKLSALAATLMTMAGLLPPHDLPAAAIQTGLVSGTFTIGPTPPPAVQGTYPFAGLWQKQYTWTGSEYVLDLWPRHLGLQREIPRLRFQSLAIDGPADVQTVRAGWGEFQVVDGSGHLHRAPAQYPDRWTAIDAPPRAAGETDLMLTADGVLFVSDQGLTHADPGPQLLSPPGEEPALTAPHPHLLFGRNAVKPGSTYQYLNYTYTRLDNTGLTLPRFFGEPADAPLRPHTLHKVISYGSSTVALGSLHPDTPGYQPGTQALFHSDYTGLGWTFVPLPSDVQWHDIATTHMAGASGTSPFYGQIVVVGEAGIYTSMSRAGPWTHIRTNTTPSSSLPFPDVGSDLPLPQELQLRLTSVTWAKDRFIAVGVAGEDDAPIIVEGAGTYWFAYPLQGWPADRRVDEIAAFSDRRLLLSRAAGPDKPALVVTNQPIFAVDGLAPQVLSPAHVTLPLGVGPRIPLQSIGTATRLIVEQNGTPENTTWSLWSGTLSSSFRVGVGPSGDQRLHTHPFTLRITPINEFGRGAPLDIQLNPALPSFRPSHPNRPQLAFPSQVKIPFGGQVHIPLKHLNPKIDWWTDRTWFLDLPAGLHFDRYQRAIVGQVREAGTFQIYIWAESDSGGNWAGPITLSVAEPSPRPVDQGAFSGLLDGAEALSGTWDVTLRANRSFTGRLRLLGSAHSFRGTLGPVEGSDGLWSTELLLRRGKREPIQLKLALDAETGRLSLHARAGEEESATVGEVVSSRPWAADHHCPRSGRYTAPIAPPESEAGAVIGRGFLSATISPRGQATVRGELANGLRWTAAAPLSSEHAIPILWKSGKRSLRGTFQFSADDLDDRDFSGQLAWRTTLAEKTPAYGASADLSVTGAPLANLAVVRRWGSDQSVTPVWMHHPELARFGFPEGSIEARFYSYYNPFSPSHHEGDAVAVGAALRIDPKTGLVSGKMTLTDSSGNKRRFPLRAVWVYSTETRAGTISGYFRIPSADGKTFHSGDIVSKTEN